MRSKKREKITSDISCKDSNLLGSSMHQKKNESLLPTAWTSPDQESPVAVVTPIYKHKMDPRRGGSSDRGKSDISSTYAGAGAGADYQEEEDFRQSRHEFGKEGYQCQNCGFTFLSRNDLMQHVQTECRVRYRYQQRHDPLPPARMSTQSNVYMSNAAERPSASRTTLDIFDSSSVTPAPHQQHYMRGISGSVEFHRPRQSRSSPTSPQMKRSAAGIHDIVEAPQELIRLLTPEELDSLSPQDRALCRSVALFCSKGPSSESQGTLRSRSASPTQNPSTQPFGSPPRAGKVQPPKSHPSTAEAEWLGHGNFLVGFQCIFCASDHTKHDKGGEAFSRVFPGSIDTIAASLNLVKERHFLSPPRTGRKSGTPSPTGGQGGCLHMPSNIRNVFESARSQASFRSREVTYEETMALQRACQNLAIRFGIDNKVPHKTGIVLQHDRTFGIGHDPPHTERKHYLDSSHPDFETGALQHPFDRRQSRREPTTFGYGSAIEPGGSGDSRYSRAPSHEYEARTKDVNFIRDAYGWCCPNCSSLPYNFRAPGYFSREEPSIDFMNRHFAVCTGLSNEQRVAEQRAQTPHGVPTSYSQRHIYSPNPYERSLMASGRARPPAYYPPVPEPQDFGHGQLAAQHFRSHMSLHRDLPREATEDSIRQAVEFLESLEEESPDPDEGTLVLPDDKLLLTDYFFYLNKQLKQCRFTEKDRKTRGGKREKIELGFGGLQCRHCAETNASRKFFWSDVDRLANSFAEIPGHILKCRKCPDEVKNALIELKLKHPEQMARLPRGSQKVFFRRMWKRLHKKDAEFGSNLLKASSPKEEQNPPSEQQQDTYDPHADTGKRSAEEEAGEGDAKKPRSDF